MGHKSWNTTINHSKRQLVEELAIEQVWNYYSRKGYVLADVQKDNVGWDLEAELGRVTLKLEVKGLSGDKLSTELTPNEYKQSSVHKHTYRICVVTNALKGDWKLGVFSYSPDSGSWEDEEGRVLKFEKRMSARLSL